MFVKTRSTIVSDEIETGPEKKTVRNAMTSYMP